ncbi:MULTISPECIES: DEAD/DEAH box helicase family protein [unclassified Dehalobacter]|uniref:DEAD/DEAH box helicase family protein n=1 Tax=unclassified Dehalobacter TaxID=2635733 RepID=UPI001052A292|nr:MULTISPECIES: DEAD/DEAH box helicase family protein [unclassified Dehalobacter]TCX51940.1 terminase B [Dehalobacter sp. 14DCB1]TCX53000.1 terminase B [Dehalobacter sp. 12DCB1]
MTTKTSTKKTKKSSKVTRRQFFRIKIPQYQKNPSLFCREVLKFEPDEWQEAALNDIAESNRVSIKSGQGVGKTGVEAAALLWFLTCFDNARVVATAPTMRQLHDVLWSEVAKWQAKSVLLSNILKWTKTYVYMLGYEKRWFAVARTATRPENMQGFHEDNMLFIVDEASGVSDPILEAILGTLSGVNNKLLMCGNPTKTSGVFYDSHTSDRALYRCHTVSSLDSRRTNKENIEALIRKYGKDSNVVRVRVFGQFPLQEDDVYIPLALIEASIMAEAQERPVETIDIGCDVARFGDDKTVIGFKINEKVEFFKKRNGQDTMRTAADIAFLGQTLIDKSEYKFKIPIKVDDGGVGGGVVDRLRQIKRSNPAQYWWMEIIPVKFGVRIKHRYYYDSTTYMMNTVRELLSQEDEDGKTKPVELILPNDNDLVGQLSARKYSMTDNSKIKIESKDDMKKRGLPSPDEADCVLLLCLPVAMKDRKKGDEKH